MTEQPPYTPTQEQTVPNYFSLTRKSNPDAGPVEFTTIDEEMCAAFGVLCDPVHWHLGWYDWVGMALAVGRDFATLRQRVQDDPEALRIVDWLDAHFTPDAWARIGGKR